MTLDPQRRRALLEAKLGALVRDHAGEAPVVFGPFGGGAALVRDGSAWVLADAQPERSLGQAMAWARQHGCRSVNVLAEADTGLLARRAAAFTDPPRVWRVEGRALTAAAAEPLPEVPAVDPRLLALVDLIEAGGAEPVVEHGVLIGEVAGLEVCRAVLDPYLDVARLEVGVGTHDREAFQLLHGDVPTVDALGAVVALVAPHRASGAPPHALGRLAAERRLRQRLVEQPALVGASMVAAAPSPLPRRSLKDVVPCAAVGVAGGRAVVVVCSVGIDLDLVPWAADARLALGPRDPLVLAVPARDVHPVTVALAARLVLPAEVIGIPPA